MCEVKNFPIPVDSILFVVTPRTPFPVKCVVESYDDEKGCFVLKREAQVDEEGNVVMKEEGYDYCYVKNGDLAFVFRTAEDAFRAIEDQKNFQSYLLEINSVDALLLFPLKHPFASAGKFDWPAVEAYKQKVKEMFQIDLET